MDRKQIQDTIMALQRQTREALRQLAEVDDVPASAYDHVSSAQHALTDHMQLLLQLKEEVMSIQPSPSPTAASSPAVCPPTPETVDPEKRTRGGQKQYYLIDNTRREEYTAQIRTLFAQHYDTGIRRFRLPNGTLVKAPLFLACIYDQGISRGLAAAGAPVKDFADIVKEAARDVPNFTTAYNTIQSVIKQWRYYIGHQGYGMLTLHLHAISIEQVVSEWQEEYHRTMGVYEAIEKLK